MCIMSGKYFELCLIHSKSLWTMIIIFIFILYTYNNEPYKKKKEKIM
jgi:hypothetical protein